ncbi:beta-1,3-glucan-binding protein-like isoform X3 [Pararge aegeria]|uniref:beta-1,3-glucan-binding protein-like isoform X3 n=1 Tax=Pararge aegeria TaxID=116150 RepID=UPI0019D259E5|nr:beta-1,3-glucan-binding protein-like isoform X3 [Pararge aegeria]
MFNFRVMWSSMLIGVLLLTYVTVECVDGICTQNPLKVNAECQPSVTTVSGTHAPKAICSGAMIFDDEFDEFDFETWQHEVTLGGGGNWEFQYYNNNRTNSFTDDGILFIRPSLTSEQFGETFLTRGYLDINGGAPADRCTNSQWYGCERTGTPTNILNPIKSARIRTVNSFSFRYGRVEVRAKLPAGDWLWPGEIDIMESRGNRILLQNGLNIGTQEAASTLHYGPYQQLNGWNRTHWVGKNETGYDRDFHLYQLEWTQDYIKFCIDDVELGKVDPGKGGFWNYGGFDSNRNILNPWRYGSKMAPFDQKFYLIINLAVGGTSGYFPDGVQNPTPKPWLNSSPKAATDFWDAKEAWLPTWGLDKNDGKNAALQVDYVRVWAL